MAFTFHVLVHALEGRAVAEVMHPAFDEGQPTLDRFQPDLAAVVGRIRAALGELAATETG